ncbi:MAG: Na+/H+ antiporter NhaA, partial [Alphaproteobacteria bacterium]
KQIGILGFSFLAIRTGLCPMPKGGTWARYYGVALLCGIGFTMSLFIGTLAYATEEMAALVRVGVICGSLASGILGYLVLRFLSRDETRAPG